MITWEDKTVIVTGGGTGVGRAICLKLAEYGAAIALNYCRSGKEALDTARIIEAMGGRVIALQADISDDAAVQKLVRDTENAFGSIHYLVNNAGITKQIDLSDLVSVTDEVWDQLFSVNVKGMFYCARAAAPIMKRQKAKQEDCALARALAPDIRVNYISPAAISTGWWEGEEEKMYRLSGDLPLQRISTPEDIAELVCSILVQSSMTGQIISPNNGMLI
ncbi:MAG: SDR family oxidoreductase [Clostridiales bacterium]|nr:SDR family oxidoreductase [Clostridiales bacterium]MDU3244022.1 SDR family oxidoreductase [Clostridiales bacterium]